MAKAQQTFSEDPQSKTFSDLPPPPPEEPAPVAAAPITEEVSSPSADPADFFLRAMDMVEQQKFLNFCEARGLTSAAGILLFLKEPLQRDQLNPIAANPFADEAQAVVDSMRPTTAASQMLAPRVGQKPVKPCAVCGTLFVVQFMGRQLCAKESCWHTYAGLSPQQPVGLASKAAGDTDRRLGRLESMMERMAGALDRLVGA